MFAISRTLGKLVQQCVQAGSGQDRDCRLLVPGLTTDIARELHEYLMENGITSYLVSEDEEPSEEKKILKPQGLTSRRIGTFVAVASPGQLIHIQDSIRGTGGTIRSVSFSEEWPWIDSVSAPPFRFDGPVLNDLLEGWSPDHAMKEWLRDFVLDGLLWSMEPVTSGRRASLLLEAILGTFDSALYPEIDDVREKLLFHSGVPRPADGRRGPIPPVKELIKSLTTLNQAIVELYKSEENVRQKAKDNTRLLEVPSSEEEKIKHSVDCFLDGVSRSSTTSLGLLSFYSCWGQDKSDSTHWRRLDEQTLRILFNVRKPRPPKKCKLYCKAIKGDRVVSADDCTQFASFWGETVGLEIAYEIPPDQFSQHRWKICLRNRSAEITEIVLDKDEGVISLSFKTNDHVARYSQKVPLRIALYEAGEINVDVRLDMYLCGPDRSDFVVIKPEFVVVDASLTGTAASPDSKIKTEAPVHIFMFSDAATGPMLFDNDDQEVGTIEIGKGITRTAQLIDASAEPAGRAIRIFKSTNKRAVIYLEAVDRTKGEFTLEGELRKAIFSSPEARVQGLADVFAGKSKKPYRELGDIDERARRRIDIANQMTTPLGWRPLLTNLLLLADGKTMAGSIGDFINHLGSVDGDSFKTLTLPDDALSCLSAYSDARDQFQQAIQSRLDLEGLALDHPLYATHPIFVNEQLNLTEELLSRYMEAYCGILDYLEGQKKLLGWQQLFVLTHLDCAVHWDNGPIKNALFLVGPWHPLVLAKRFMVQAALFSRAQRLSESNGKSFRHLSSLLGRVQGFRWLVGLSVMDTSLEPFYISITSDPGWHVAININRDCRDLMAREVPGGLSGIYRILEERFGLEVDGSTNESTSLVNTCLESYRQAFPSRRSIGMRVRQGYSEAKAVKAADTYLHGGDKPTMKGRGLPGGVRLYFEKPVGEDIGESKWSDPPLHIYQYKYEDDATCIQVENPDIYMLPPENEPSFLRRDKCKLPRGVGRQAVFSQPLNWLTEGNTLIPSNVTYEFDSDPINRRDGIGGRFVDATHKIAITLDDLFSKVSSVNLPERLTSPWVVIPGHDIDPAILVEYVRVGSERAIQDRALWGYKIDLASKQTSYFILSTIPPGFEIAVKGFFSCNITNSVLVDLGKIGIAIGAEALKTGRHALGAIGFIGAVRLFKGTENSVQGPLAHTSTTIGFILPVDSFTSFFGKKNASETGIAGPMADLLAIVIVLPRGDSGQMVISCCGIEAKFTSGTFSDADAQKMIKQARATAIEFKDLVETSLREGAMPERLAMIELLKFGLRANSPSLSQRAEMQKWTELEVAVYSAALSGNYRFCDASYNAVLVSTEGQLHGVPEYRLLPEGVWIRLTKGHWPGISDTPQLESIRLLLSSLFKNCVEQQAAVQTTSAVNSQKVRESNPEVPRSENESETILGPTTAPQEEPEDVGQVEEINTPDRTAGQLVRILLGVDMNRREVYFDPQTPVSPLQNMHLMVTGSSGVGKTQFLKYLVCEFREQKKSVLLLDFKNDFAGDTAFAARAGLDRVSINFDGLPYNPLIPYPIKNEDTGDLYLQCGQHIAGVVSVLEKMFGLGTQQAMSLKSAIASAFTANGIQATGQIPYSENLRFPDFNQVGQTLSHDNPMAYNRLDPIFTLEIFRDKFVNMSFQSLVGRSAILDLSKIASEPIKNALAQLLVLSAHAYYLSQPHSGVIRQVLVFDEAHRVLKSEYMARLVRECRAFGVATLLSSQNPVDFPREISASMATKILHGNGSDVKNVKDIVQLIGANGREGDVATLKQFQAFIDNRHYPQTLVRTMNYPLYLVWTSLREHKKVKREDLCRTAGLDTTKLSIDNLISQLELWGYAEERDGEIILIKDV